MKRSAFDHWIHNILHPDGKNIDLRRLAAVHFLTKQLALNEPTKRAACPLCQTYGTGKASRISDYD